MTSGAASKATLPEHPDAYYVREGSLLVPTLNVQGAWRLDEQHAAPPTGLLLHEVQRLLPRDDVQIGRATFEILGMIPALPGTVSVEVIRPGRTIELVRATLSIEGRDVLRAHVWRVATGDTSAVAGSELPRIPAPSELTSGRRFADLWRGQFIAGVELAAPEERTPGRGMAWIRSPFRLVAGETSDPTAHMLRLTDCANGLATRVDPSDWGFPNLDLTIHLFRQPSLGSGAEEGWLGLDIDVAFGPSGLGLTTTTLHDEHGPFGRAEQILTVRDSHGS